MNNKPLDAVRMTRRIRDKMYDETKDLDADELIRYFAERSEGASRKVKEREEQEEKRSRMTLQ